MVTSVLSSTQVIFRLFSSLRRNVKSFYLTETVNSPQTGTLRFTDAAVKKQNKNGTAFEQSKC